MSEDVSATMRVGITVILVAALVATVLNLMVMSNSLLNGGQTTLQSGIDSVSTQEFAAYDNTKVSGTQVTTALSLFQGRDVAILIQTKALTSIGTGAGGTNNWSDIAINYGALVTSDGQASNSTNNDLTVLNADTTGQIEQIGFQLGDEKSNIITAQAKTAYLVRFVDGTKTNAKESVWRETGAPFYTAYLHNSNGMVDTSYDIIGTTELGNAAYILSSSRFSSTLIKDPTGSIIGIFFKQLN